MTKWAPLLLAAVALAGCVANAPADDGAPDEPAGLAAASEASVTTVPCAVVYPPSTLPRWARTGFSGPAPSAPHVLGDRGDIAAILWAEREPLTAPPSPERNNKILWVARVGRAAGPLRITAVLDDTGKAVTRTVDPAPGPSIIDLPTPGCWSLDLKWGRHDDRLRLAYAPG